MTKRYDQAYFNRWYRDPGTRVVTRDSLERKVRLAVSAAEYMLARPIRSVLDVGCGEGAWRSVLVRMRPGISYLGVDPSEYAVRRHGARRNLRLASFGELPMLKLRGRYDLVVCSDVLQYVGPADLSRGLAEITRVLGGVAYIEAYTTEDEMEGDHEGWIPRSRAWYRRAFSAAGLTHCGLHCWVNEPRLDAVLAFERGSP
jgi:SAM-dependent methyltransferase